MSIQVKDANGATQTINSLPPLGAALSAASLPMVPATDASFPSTTVDGGCVTLGAKADAAYAGSGAASVVALLKAIWNELASTLSVSWTGSPNVTVANASLTVSDSQSAAVSGVVAMTVGSIYAAARSVGVLCTVAGNVSFTFSDASTLVIPVVPGWQTFPFAVTQVNSAGTTATATYFNLK